jgi:hypothetical protein
MARSSLHETYEGHQTADMDSVSGSCISQDPDYDLENAPVVMYTSLVPSQDGSVLYSRLPHTGAFTTSAQENSSSSVTTVMQDAPTMHGTNSDTSVQEALMPGGVDTEPDKDGIIARKWHWKTMGMVFGLLLTGKFSGLTSRKVLLARDSV